jgi:hypothetical protein
VSARTKEERRFWSKVRVGDGCWEWTAPLADKGYGRFAASTGAMVYAHRWTYAKVHGPIPSGMSVCHRCDNPRCVRPSHLFIGMHAENMADMGRKGRQRGPRGATHHSAKLNAHAIGDIKAAHASGETFTAIAARFGVSRHTVYCIVRGKTWKGAA